jgi:hypothetical protein
MAAKKRRVSLDKLRDRRAQLQAELEEVEEEIARREPMRSSSGTSSFGGLLTNEDIINIVDAISIPPYVPTQLKSMEIFKRGTSS